MHIKFQVFLIHFLQLLSQTKCNFEERLRDHIFKNYSALVRPVRNPKSIIHVTFNIKLIQVLAVDERDQKVTTQSYYSMKWKNEFLTWNPQDWGNISLIFVKPNKVWIPDIILKNKVGSNSATVQENTDFVHVYHDGNNGWYPKLMMTSSFAADVKNYPFDKQVFDFHFTSWRLGSDKLHIHNDKKPMLDKYFVNSTEWDLVKMKKKLPHTAYNSDSYSEIIFEYVFSRKSSYCVNTAILPCFILMMIVLSSYLLPPNCGERIGVLITAILAFTVFLQMVNASLPRNSDSIPMLKLFYLVTMAECTLCFLASCLAIRLLNKKESTIPLLPFWMKKYLICMERYLNHNENGVGELRPVLERPFASTAVPSTENSCELQERNSFKQSTKKETEKDEAMFTMQKKPNTAHPSDVTKLNHTESNMGSKVNQRKLDQKLANELAWKQWVEYLDRLCLYVFFTLFSLTSVMLLLPAYLNR